MLRLTAFHVRLFWNLPFFVQLMVLTTLVAGLSQRLGVAVWGGDAWEGMVRTGFIGMWATLTAAGGILRFERGKGTLAALFSARIPQLAAMLPPIIAVAVFAACAFPLAVLLWCVPGAGAVKLAVVAASLPFTLPALAVVFFGCCGVALVVAAVFVLISHAVAYETLLSLPLLVVSGVFGAPAGVVGEVLCWISPTMRVVVRVLLAGDDAAAFSAWCSIAAGAFSASCWCLFGGWLLHRFILLARRGAVEVV